MKIPRYGFAVLFGLALLAFTGYLLADTFLIKRVYSTAAEEPATQTVSTQAVEESDEIAIVTAEPDEASPTAEPAQAAEPVTTDTTYSDGNISVQLSTYRLSETTVYVADVRLSSADYLRTALAENSYGRNITEKTSSMASSVNAILAINGDYYGAQRSGYVIRNGVLYRSTSGGGEDLVIYADGSFGIINEDDVTAEELLASGARNVLSFGPALVEDGEIAVSENDEVGRAMASNPRTAIGVIDDLHYVFVVADGRTSDSDGLSLHELATFLQSIGCKTAYNLDGGGSSSMVFLGTLVNNPVNGRKSSERSVSDIVYIGYGA
ncbi:MAG: phosphodiester glycosidase family protein [Clostridia bacterium]|nr:phosphodiester glycosidase family protein [Clostridia bacterium]